MAQTINIYIGESNKASTDFALQESIAEEPSPEGFDQEDTMMLDDSNAPEPEMFDDEGKAGLDDDIAPTPFLMDEIFSEEIGRDMTIPMPLDEPSASTSSENDAPEPEDFEEGQMVKASVKKSVTRKKK